MRLFGTWFATQSGRRQRDDNEIATDRVLRRLWGTIGGVSDASLLGQVYLSLVRNQTTKERGQQVKEFYVTFHYTVQVQAEDDEQAFDNAWAEFARTFPDLTATDFWTGEWAEEAA